MKRVLSRIEAQDYVGGKENLTRLEASGLVKAFSGKTQARDFDIRDLDKAIDQVKLMGWQALEAVGK